IVVAGPRCSTGMAVKRPEGPFPVVESFAVTLADSGSSAKAVTRKGAGPDGGRLGGLGGVPRRTERTGAPACRSPRQGLRPGSGEPACALPPDEFAGRTGRRPAEGPPQGPNTGRGPV